MYAVYGKRIEKMPNGGPDKTFMALTYQGVRTRVKEDIGTFATKEDAEEHLREHVPEDVDGILFEIRKVS